MRFAAFRRDRSTGDLQLHIIATNLGLAGTSSSRTAGASARSLSADDILRVGQRGLAHPAKRLAGSRALVVLLVGGEVEGDEKDEVRAENAHAREGGKLLTSALAGIGHPGEVGRGKVGVGGEVDEACAGKELAGVTDKITANGERGLPRSMTN